MLMEKFALLKENILQSYHQWAMSIEQSKASLNYFPGFKHTAMLRRGSFLVQCSVMLPNRTQKSNI